MSGTYKLIELVGVSNESHSAAIKVAIDKAKESLKGLSWFEVVELRGGISTEGNIEFQAKIKVSFKLQARQPASATPAAAEPAPPAA